MPVKPCPLNKPLKINADKKENVSRGTPMFPCEGYITYVGGNIAQDLPWHWHEEIEVLVVTKGKLKIEFIDQSYNIKKGEGVFINSSVLKSATSIGNESCEIKSLVFHPGIISGMTESSFEQRYVRPLINCTKLPRIIFEKGIKWHIEAIQYILDAFYNYDSESFGYEILVREKLSRLWLLIMNNYKEVLNEQNAANDIDSLRLKNMLTFIHSNYMNQIGLSDIAKTAAISERECLRCFKRTIGISPVQYLTRYRISLANNMLVNSGMSISEICYQTGFESPSYFSHIFKKLISMTPKEYRALKK